MAETKIINIVENFGTYITLKMGKEEKSTSNYLILLHTTWKISLSFYLYCLKQRLL